MIMVGICARTGHRPPTGSLGGSRRYRGNRSGTEISTPGTPTKRAKNTTGSEHLRGAGHYDQSYWILSRRMHGNGEALPFQGYTEFGGRRGMEEEA